MDVFVVAIALADVAGEAVDGEVELAEANRLGGLLLTVDADRLDGILAVAFDELCALDEHSATATGGVQDAAVEGLDDIDDELDDGGRCKELTALLALGHSELAEEVLIDLAEGVALDVHGDGVKNADQLGERAVVDAVVVLGQDVAKLFVFGLNGAHRVVQGAADVLALAEVHELRPARGFGQVHHAPRLIVRAGDRASGAAAAGELSFGLVETLAGVAEEDQAEDGRRVFLRAQLRVRTQFVSGVPETLFDFSVVGGHGMIPGFVKTILEGSGGNCH